MASEDFNAQHFLMRNPQYFCRMSALANDKYNNLIPIVGEHPTVVEHAFKSPSGVTPTSPGIKNFMEIETKDYSALRPEISLYKVHYPKKESKGEDIYIPFESSYSKEERANILKNRAGRGVGSGILSFSWEYAGKNPAEAKTFINANLKIYLSSIKELDKIRHTTTNKANDNPVSLVREVRYIDLITMYPREIKTVNPAMKVDLDEYDPKYYQLRADVGYMIPMSKTISPLLKEALRRCTTTMYLSLYKHDLEFKDNGSVIISIDYIGRLSTIFADSKKDVLRDGLDGFTKYLLDSGKMYETVIAKHQTPGQPDEYRFVTGDDELSLQQIMSDLREKYKSAKYVDMRTALKADPNNANVLKDHHASLKYFYFGDLMAWAIDKAFGEQIGGGHDIRDDLTFLIGPVIIDVPGGSKAYINLCDIPISKELYVSWFDAHIAGKKDINLSLLSFFELAFSHLIRQALADVMPESSIPRLTFSEFSVKYGLKADKKKDPLFDLGGNDMSSREVFADIEEKIKKKLRRSALTGGAESHQYFYFHASHRTFNPSLLVGNKKGKAQHARAGVYYLASGLPVGPVKSIKFKKQDVPFQKEANIERQGRAGRNLLRSFYNADVEMIGSPMFTPGTVVYIDANAMNMGNPEGGDKSLAKLLGIGGYYLIIKASHEISAGNFNTTLDCSFLGFGKEKSQNYISLDLPTPSSDDIGR